MKTTIEISDDLFRQAKARAALDGRSLKDLVTDALRRHLQSPIPETRTEPGWRKVFGKAAPGAIAELDAVLAQEFNEIELDDWK
jgi:Bacterial antitoxin of type II TA system, VapB